MPISSVNLDEETQAISKRVGNFSEFVRECLRRWNAHDTATHVHPNKSDKCFPMSRKGCCILCWPDGAPDLADWKYYLESGGKVVTGQTKYKVKNQIGETYNPIFAHDVPYNNKWIEEKARESNISPEFSIPKTEDFKKSRDVEKIGLYARFKRFFRLD